MGSRSLRPGIRAQTGVPTTPVVGVMGWEHAGLFKPATHRVRARLSVVPRKSQRKRPSAPAFLMPVDPDKPTDAEKIAYYDTFIAWCASTNSTARRSTVTHFPELAWTPS